MGLCAKYKALKPLEIGRYAAGQKRCNFCAIFINCDGTICPCCKSHGSTALMNREAIFTFAVSIHG
jgi:hypothetical protein